uniref:Uncharacterized protein n=1 Tax=Chelonoidis abingdonii TaxID=106734 RepID=A0A8C0GH92_CHEAB
MATAAYVDHFAAECLVSMSNRAIIHSPKGNADPRPDAAVPPPLSNGENKREVRETGKDNGSSLFVVARILRAKPKTKDLWQIFPSQSSSKDPHRLVTSWPKIYSLQFVINE